MARTLLIGDVHGCAVELEALLERAAAQRVILLGDLFTKGPDPVGVWRLIQGCGAEAVMGNHDRAVIQRWRQQQVRRVPLSAIAWLESLPLAITGEGWLAIHAGVHPTAGLAGTDAAAATLLRRWPDDSDVSSPFWWELYTGEPLVIYGHDARRGLVDRRPRTLGLDAGCVYGGALLGYLLEDDTILWEPARRIYRQGSVAK